MAHRQYILSREPLVPADVVAKARGNLEAADWWICAEWAGYDDDDEARAVVGRLRAMMEVRAHDAPPALDLAFGSLGAVRVEAIGSERTRVLAEVRADLQLVWLDGAVDAVMIVLSGLPDQDGQVVRELASAIGIGLAGQLHGAFLDGDRLWDPAERRWR